VLDAVNKDISKSQIVMARRLGHIISKTARLVGCYQSAEVRIYQQWSEKGQTGDRVLGAQCSSLH